MYTLKWKNPALVINGIPDANKEMPITVLPGSVVADKAPIKFTGKGAGNYGQIQQENLMRLMEHFADIEQNPPENPTVGLIWYDTTNSQLKLCVQTAPTKWRVVAGIIITNVGQEAPLGQLGDIWFERTGPLSGYLYVYTGTGRYPLAAQGLGGWNQVWPNPDMAGGREEYDQMYSILQQLIGSPTLGGNGAITRAIQNIDSLTSLDAALKDKYENTPDLILSPFEEDVDLLKVNPVSADWDTLLAAIKYAINRLDLPASVKNGISDFPFVQDGRQAPASLFDLDPSDKRYPAPLRRVLRQMGYIAITRLYSSTVDALEKGLIDRYSIQGINGGTLHSTAIKTPHVIFGGSQLNKGTTSNLRMAFRFANKDAQDRFLFSGGAIQVTMRHSTSQIGSSDQELSTFLSNNGAFRITADKVRVFNNAFAPASMVASNVGLKDATSEGKSLIPPRSSGPNVKLTAFRVSDTRIDLDISLVVPLALNGKTTFKYEIIEDVEKYMVGTTETRVYPGVLPYAAGDSSGSSWYAVDTNDEPPQVNVPAGTLLYTVCAGTSMNGVIADGNGGTYTNVLQTNSPQCEGTACSSSLFGNGSIAIPSKVTAITLVGKAGTTLEPVIATVDGQTKTFTTATNTTTTVTFTANATGKTLTFTIPAGGTLSMAYCDYVPAPPKPEGELLRTECRGFDKWGIYADGNYGETSRIIEANSVSCGYASATPAATFDVSFVTMGPSSTVPWNEAFMFRLSSITGFTAGQTYTVTSTVTGAATRTESLGTFQASGTGTAATIEKSFTNDGAWPSGSYSVTTVIKNAAGTTILTLGPRTFSLATNAANNPTAALFINGAQTVNQPANVGDLVAVRGTAAKFAPNSTVTFYLDITGADNRTTGPFVYTSDAAGNVSWTFSNTLLENPTIRGDVTYRIRAIGNDATGASKTATSNSITLTWTKSAPTPNGELFMNNSKTTLNANVGDSIAVRMDMKNFGANVPLTVYLDIAGADNRTTGPFAFTTDANGAVTNTHQNTLLLNPTIKGDVRYKIRVTGNDQAGISKNVTSNEVTISWTKVAAAPTSAIFIDNSQANKSVIVGTMVSIRMTASNFAPNSPINYHLFITGVDNRSAGPFAYTTDSAGNQTNTHSQTLLLSPTMSGNVSYKISVTGNDQNGVQKTVQSNSISINWISPTPSITTSANYSEGYSTSFVGDNVPVVLSGMHWKPYSQVTFYLYITGAENRTTGPFVHTADANGNIFDSFVSTLLGNPNIRGNVYYAWSGTGSKLDGSYASVSSNQVTINWRAR